jgi:hypothetical protein
MSAALDNRNEIVDPAAAFRARCEAQAFLVTAGELAVHKAVDALQAAAAANGLVAELGQDAVQEIMSAAFVRTLALASTMTAPIPPDEPLEHRPAPGHLAASTIDALRYVISQRDPERLRSWLTRRPRGERQVMKSLMAPK